MSDRFKDLLAGIVLIGIFVFLSFFTPGIALGIQFILLFGILFHAYLLGKRLCPKNGWAIGTLTGIISILSLQSLIQTAWFYVNGTLGNTTDIISLAATILICQLLVWIIPEAEEEFQEKKIDWNITRVGLALACTAVTLASVGYTLFSAARVATLDSIRTPWPLLPTGTLAAIAVAWLAVFVSIRLVKSRALAAAQAGLALLATTALTPLIYRLGFGFDGFLHVAAEKLILLNGTLSPKPLYYIGQYVFTTWLARLGNLPIESIDRWLVPVAAAILLPLAALLSQDETEPGYTPFLLLLIPLAPFIATTPQSFAYVLGLAALILAAGFHSRRAHPILALLLALWSVAIHPLAGVPILCVVLALLVSNLRHRIRLSFIPSVMAWILVLASAAAVPILFLIVSRGSATPITWNISSLFTAAPWGELFSNLTPWIGNHYVVWPAWASLVAQALPSVLLIAAISSIVGREKGERQELAVLLGAGCLLFISAMVLKTAGDFAFLIDYERGNYADRLNVLAIFCLIPAALPSLNRLLGRLKTTSPLLQTGLIASCVAVAAATSYNALPRNDALITGHGWSVGRADIDAVHTIDRDAGDAAYTVLANQSVSAAAVSQLGFKRYAGDVFFYPIPTGGSLYDAFLRMTYQEPSRDTAVEAAALGKSSLVYVVLNDYWWRADAVADELSTIADKTWDLGDASLGIGHAVHVYKFDLSKK